MRVGESVGCGDGPSVGVGVPTVGAAVGPIVGGELEGVGVGPSVGVGEGTEVGDIVGDPVGGGDDGIGVGPAVAKGEATVGAAVAFLTQNKPKCGKYRTVSFRPCLFVDRTFCQLHSQCLSRRCGIELFQRQARKRVHSASYFESTGCCD